MKILITGAKGMLGTDLVSHLSNKFEIIPIDIEIDITDQQKIQEKIFQVKPEIIIHTAAYTDVDGCEKNLELAFKVNAQGTKNIASICDKISAKFIYISTDYVFDGEKPYPEYYYEFDRVNPISVYGKSKLEGENFVLESCKNYLIIRIAGLFGESRQNFVSWIIDNIKRKENFSVVSNLYSTPTYSKDLAFAIEKVILKDLSGIAHITNKGITSKFEIANYIKDKLKSNVHITPILDSDIKTWIAKRPQNSALGHHTLETTVGDFTRHYQDAIDEFMWRMEKSY